MFLGIGKEGTNYTNWTFSRVSLYALINYYNATDPSHGRVTISHEDINFDRDSISEGEGLHMYSAAEEDEEQIPLFSEDVFQVAVGAGNAGQYNTNNTSDTTGAGLLLV